jgi:hypothetical protein
MKRFSKKLIECEIRSAHKHDLPKRNEVMHHRSQGISTDPRPRSTIFADHFCSLFASPAQAADGLVKMVTKMEDVATVPFLTALDFAENIALKFEQSACYLVCQEEVRQVAKKAI